MSGDPTPRLGRAVRYFTPVVITAGLAVPMFAAADRPGNPGQQGNPNPGQPNNQGQHGNPGQSEQHGQQGNPNPGQPNDQGQQGNPGQSGEHGRPDDPGQSGEHGRPDNPGQSGEHGNGPPMTPPGHGGENPGNGGEHGNGPPMTPPGHGGENPGNGGEHGNGPPMTPPGHGGTPPGQGGTPPGHGGTPPGHGGTPPGHGGENPGNGQNPPKGDKGEQGEKGDPGESSSTTVVDWSAPVVTPAPLFSEASKAPGLTDKPVVKRACTSRRVVTMRLDRYYRIRAARVLVNGRVAKVRRTRNGKVVKIDLRGKKEGVYTVRTAVVTKSGKLKLSTRKFATCSARVKKRA